MKSLIVYSSQTGNTRKLAEAVYEAVDGEKKIAAVADAPDPAGYDWVAVGFWLMGGKPDPKAQAYLQKLGKGQKVFLFATHGAAAGSAHAIDALEHARSLVTEAELVGVFSCPGEINPAVLDKLKAKNPPPPWLADAPNAVGRPNQKDIDALKAVVAWA